MTMQMSIKVWSWEDPSSVKIRQRIPLVKNNQFVFSFQVFHLERIPVKDVCQFISLLNVNQSIPRGHSLAMGGHLIIVFKYGIWQYLLRGHHCFVWALPLL
jgi:hypothetical protein